MSRVRVSVASVKSVLTILAWAMAPVRWSWPATMGTSWPKELRRRLS